MNARGLFLYLLLLCGGGLCAWWWGRGEPEFPNLEPSISNSEHTTSGSVPPAPPFVPSPERELDRSTPIEQSVYSLTPWPGEARRRVDLHETVRSWSGRHYVRWVSSRDPMLHETGSQPAVEARPAQLEWGRAEIRENGVVLREEVIHSREHESGLAHRVFVLERAPAAIFLRGPRGLHGTPVVWREGADGLAWELHEEELFGGGALWGVVWDEENSWLHEDRGILVLQVAAPHFAAIDLRDAVVVDAGDALELIFREGAPRDRVAAAQALADGAGSFDQVRVVMNELLDDPQQPMVARFRAGVLLQQASSRDFPVQLLIDALGGLAEPVPSGQVRMEPPVETRTLALRWMLTVLWDRARDELRSTELDPLEVLQRALHATEREAIASIDGVIAIGERAVLAAEQAAEIYGKVARDPDAARDARTRAVFCLALLHRKHGVGNLETTVEALEGDWDWVLESVLHFACEWWRGRRDFRRVVDGLAALAAAGGDRATTALESFSREAEHPVPARVLALDVLVVAYDAVDPSFARSIELLFEWVEGEDAAMAYHAADRLQWKASPAVMNRLLDAMARGTIVDLPVLELWSDHMSLHPSGAEPSARAILAAWRRHGESSEFGVAAGEVLKLLFDQLDARSLVEWEEFVARREDASDRDAGDP